MNVLLVGEESAGIQTLKMLLAGPHKVVAVMASESKVYLGNGTLWNVAQKLGCRMWPANLVKDPGFAQIIHDEQIDILINVHSLFIINEKVVMAPKLGSYNLHPGPLPRYAGLNAVSWAIYRGERTHGVTLHRMLAGIDTGPIAYQAMVDITDEDTALSLSFKCVRAGLPLVSKLLDTALSSPGAVPAIPQDRSRREYFGKEIPEQGMLRWDKPAKEIYDFVRACDYFPFKSPWDHPRVRCQDREIAIIKVALTGEPCSARPGTVGPAVGPGVKVASATGWVLVNLVRVDGQTVHPATVWSSGEILG